MPGNNSLLTTLSKKSLGILCLTTSLGLISAWVFFCVLFCAPT